MALTITIISDHRELVGDDSVRAFHEQGGTIGRSLQNDWILPDPDRFISGRHATIDFRGGMYYLADTSTNGVFMNDEDEPIGKGNPRRLFDGDRMRMGDFEFEVHIEDGESLSVPLDSSAPLVDRADTQQFVEEDIPDSGVDLLDEQEITGDDEFQSILFGSGPKKAAQQAEPAVELHPDDRFVLEQIGGKRQGGLPEGRIQQGGQQAARGLRVEQQRVARVPARGFRVAHRPAQAHVLRLQ